jgi:FkbM family methyltransferase
MRADIRQRVPVAKFSPIETFLYRTYWKIMFVTLSNMPERFRNLTSFTKIIDQNAGITTVELRRRCRLGEKGSMLSLVEDDVIFRTVSYLGSWEPEESKFLSSRLRKLRKRNSVEQVCLVDLGANTGLISRQTIRRLDFEPYTFLIEPIDKHMRCAKFNVRAQENSRYTFLQVALGRFKGEIEIYSQFGNFGNSSLSSDLVPEKNKIVEKVKLETPSIIEDATNSFTQVVLKSDLQGYDAYVCSELSHAFWEKVDSGVIEVWATAEQDLNEVDIACKVFNRYFDLSWSYLFNTRISVVELSSFWLSKSEQWKNLYLRRKSM